MQYVYTHLQNSTMMMRMMLDVVEKDDGDLCKTCLDDSTDQLLLIWSLPPTTLTKLASQDVTLEPGDKPVSGMLPSRMRVSWSRSAAFIAELHTTPVITFLQPVFRGKSCPVLPGMAGAGG